MFLKIEESKNYRFQNQNRLILDDLGYPHFLETAICVAVPG